MITPQQFLDAVADFEGLVANGCECHAALVEAASSNGINDPAVFEMRLTREMSIEDRVEVIRRKADHNRFLALVNEEFARFKKREDPYGYAQIGLFGDGGEELIMQRVEAALGRSLTEHEALLIEERWSPRIFDLRQELRFGIKPVRKRPFRSE